MLNEMTCVIGCTNAQALLGLVCSVAVGGSFDLLCKRNLVSNGNKGQHARDLRKEMRINKNTPTTVFFIDVHVVRRLGCGLGERVCE